MRCRRRFSISLSVRGFQNTPKKAGTDPLMVQKTALMALPDECATMDRTIVFVLRGLGVANNNN